MTQTGVQVAERRALRKLAEGLRMITTGLDISFVVPAVPVRRC